MSDIGSESKATSAIRGELRAARQEDAESVASILAEAFPALYTAAFGRLSEGQHARLLAALFEAEMLSLHTTLVCERAGAIAGIAKLHIGEPIAHGGVRAYWRLLRREIGLRRAPRALLGSLACTTYLEHRIPRAADLVYVEALAVAATERGQGVGTLLLHAASEWGQERRRTRMALHVLHSNTGARRLYERLGFRPWREEPARHPRPGRALLMLRPPARTP